MEIVSTEEAARRLKVTPQRIRQLCKAHGIGRMMGRFWVLTSEDMELLRAIPRKLGRPRTKPEKEPKPPPLRVEIDPRSRLAIKDKRTRPKDDKGREGELDF